jgi:sulfonate transport system ATP-binding protein
VSGVHIEGAVRSFGAKVVLRDLDLDIPDGQFIAIVGRSGSGKSTLLRLVAGLDEPDGGTITATDQIAVAFQEARLLPWLTVAQNVAFGLPRAGRDESVATALAEVGLAGSADAWPLTLSGGQAQRVSLARALVRRPRLVLLDEPFGALDALTKLEAQNLVSGLATRHGWTVLMVTHDVAEALRIADRVIVLGDGAVLGDIDIPGRGPRPYGFEHDTHYAAEILGLLGVSREIVGGEAA